MTKSESRKPRQTIPSFLRIPWWVSVLLAIASYCGLKYIAPQLSLTNQSLQNLAAAAPGLAPIAAIVFLLLAAFRLYDTEDKELTKDPDGPNDTDT